VYGFVKESLPEQPYGNFIRYLPVEVKEKQATRLSTKLIELYPP
jgi:hypothetical protein